MIRLESLLRYRHTGNGEITARPGTGPEEVPRYVVYRYAGGYVRAVRAGLSPRARTGLAQLPPHDAFDFPERVDEILGPRGDRKVDVLYHFPVTPPPAIAAGANRQGAHYVVFADARPIAWAWTVEEHGRAERGAVETVEQYRRQGHGRRALAAWTRHVIEVGKVAIVEHGGDDSAGRGLLHSLGAAPFATRVAFP